MGLTLLAAATGGPAMAAKRKLKLVAFGDSLTAGYNLPASAAFPAQLEKALRAKGFDVEIINAGVSGDTTTSAMGRLDWSIPDGTDGVIMELGANDALRGVDPGLTENNFRIMLQKLQDRGIPVLLAGMLAPRNMGENYVKLFDGMYRPLAAQFNATYYPFFLQGIAGDPKLNLPDGIHPNAEGVAVIVKNILPTVEDFIRQIQTGS
ncbi:arylesterase [Rhizobiales bacterium TNE-4]|nr:arylesterase [Rhizobiales bacterium TNE-4]MBV1827957.1 arylesterase [Rhizobiales bacterium TNE-4]